MQKIFHNILMPVGLHGNSFAGINSAIQFANHLDCHLHLLAVNAAPVFKFNIKKIEARAKAKMLELKSECHQKLKPGLKLFTTFRQGPLWNTTAQYAGLHAIDLVLAPDRFERNAIISDRDAAIVQCPVLRMQFDDSRKNFKTIVLPIESSFAVNQIRIAVYLARQFDATIHLISPKRDGMVGSETDHIERTYRVLKNNTEVPIVCHAIHGKNLSAKVVQYANEVNAGLLVLNPSTKSTFSSLLGRVFPVFRNKNTSVPVLTVF
jgi:hypothetical protein